MACKPTRHGHEPKLMGESAQGPVYIKGRKAPAAPNPGCLFLRFPYECLDGALPGQWDLESHWVALHELTAVVSREG